MKIKAVIENEPLQLYSKDAVAVTCANGGINFPGFQIKFVEVQDGKRENRSSNAGGNGT